MKVIITGMGPYPDGQGGRIDFNTSHLVATTLPKVLDPNTSRNPSPIPIQIIALPNPIKTEYGQARAIIKDLHDKYADSDVELFVHLGEARGWDFVTVERVAYKQGMSSTWWNPQERQGYYNIPDDIGEVIGDVKTCPWNDIPTGISPSIDPDRIVEGANAVLKARYYFAKNDVSKSVLQREEACGLGSKAAVVDSSVAIQVKTHDEAGPYLCGFTNYESLANRYVRKLARNVLFCHIPGEADEQQLARTRDGVAAVIVAAVNEVEMQKEKNRI